MTAPATGALEKLTHHQPVSAANRTISANRLLFSGSLRCLESQTAGSILARSRSEVASMRARWAMST